MKIPLALFLVGLACGYLLHPAPERALRSRCERVLAEAGAHSLVSVGGPLVVVAVPAGDLPKEAARALASTALRPNETLAVVTLPARGFPYLLLAVQLGLPLLAWAALRSRGPGHVALTAPLWQCAAAQAAVDGLRTRIARERGVLLPELPVRPGFRWQVRVQGEEQRPPADPRGLSKALEGRLAELLRPQDVAVWLEAWRSTHPATVRELQCRFGGEELLRAVRRSLDRGEDLRDLQGWAARLMAGQPC